MRRWVVGSILHGKPIELFLVPASATAVICGMVHIFGSLLLIEKSSPCGGRRFFLSLTGPLPYVRRHITVNTKI